MNNGINGNKLAGKIVEKGYNYGTVAEEVGVDRNTISSAIAGKYSPSYKVMNALYYVLELTPDEAADIFLLKTYVIQKKSNEHRKENANGVTNI